MRYANSPGWRLFRAGVVAASLAGACSGEISASGASVSPSGKDPSAPGGSTRVGDPPDMTKNAGMGGTGGGTMVPASPRCAGAPPSVGRAPLRRLNSFEYNNTIRDLLGDDSRPADAFGGGSGDDAAAQSVSPLLAERFMTAAEDLAARAVKDMPRLLACDPTKGEEACARQFIDRFGLRGFRRPLAPAERDGLVAVYTKVRAGETFATAIQTVVEAVLQSASFFYRPELGDPTTAQDGLVRLTDHEVASRLSYMLWGSMPDEPLLAAAGKAALRTSAQVRVQAVRMLADPRARNMTYAAFGHALLLDGIGGATKDAQVFPQHNANVDRLYQEETRRFFDHVLWQADGKWDTLMTAPFTFANRALADFYGLKGPAGTAFERVELDASKRRGFLSLGGLMARLAKPNQADPIGRGKYVREHVLCQHLPEPPPNFDTKVPEPNGKETTRERFARHSQDPACAPCHKLIDPVGFAFENFDGVGRWRDVENGRAIDGAGELTAADVEGTFKGPAQLAMKLSGSQEARNCVVTGWFRHGYGRVETEADSCSMERLRTEFAASGSKVADLTVALTQTDAFLWTVKR